MKKRTWFFPLHPVPFYRQDYEKQVRSYELATSFSELQNMFTKIDFLVWPFESGNWKEKEKKALNISRTKSVF